MTIPTLRRSLLSVAAAAFLCTDLSAAGCEGTEHRQFDFWIGQWRVENPEGKLAGHSHITSILDGCAIRERWKGARGNRGNSLNSYDASTGNWHQFWTDNHGLTLSLEGGWSEGEMVLEGSRRDARDRTVHDRIRWRPDDDGSVVQTWEQAVDGDDYRVIFTGHYLPDDGKN